MDWAFIGPVRNIAPTRDMNALIRFPSSFDELPTAFCIAPALSFFFRLLTCQTVCGSGFQDFSNRPIISTLAPFWILEAASSFALRFFFFSISRFFYFSQTVPRPLDAVETRLYGWVEEAVLTQPSLDESDLLPEFRRNFPLMEDSGAEGDYVLEAARPSDRVPFRADEDGPHFLWVYQELFTCLRMRLPFSDFQRDVMTRCRVAVSQLHQNGWGFILAFEKVCLHYGFRPTIRLFFYIYDVHFPPGGYGYISFRARDACASW
ncbi:hypothetical protein PIB30_019277, partial [Stylosanthes scabra]|nr:hypothetical protein [Stylosanthes scabra]